MLCPVCDRSCDFFHDDVDVMYYECLACHATYIVAYDDFFARWILVDGFYND